MKPRIQLMAAVALAAAMTSPVFAGEWIANAAGCKLWDPDPTPNEQVTWTGACQDGYATGPGVLEWIVDGALSGRSEGEYVHGKLEGQGTRTYANGNRYEGEFVADRPSGQGVYKWVKGDRYEGEFRDGKPNGHGILTRDDGARVEGTFADGRLIARSSRSP